MITAKSSFPVFIVDSIHLSKEFYTKNFNFNVVFENEWYIHFVSDSGIQIGFMLPEQETQPQMFQNAFKGSGVIFSLEVENAEDAYKEAKSSSLSIVLDLRKEDWGQYHFCIKDPNGIYLDIIQTFVPTPEYEESYV